MFEEMKEFAETILKDDNTLVNSIKESLPNQAQQIDSELKKQARTLAQDIDKFKNGKMSYSEMRAMYG